MRFPFQASPAEIRADEEEARLRRLSMVTLCYMYEHGLAFEGRLRRHGGDLAFLAGEEHDLLEAMRLDARQRRVKRNEERASRRNVGLLAEILRREAGLG